MQPTTEKPTSSLATAYIAAGHRIAAAIQPVEEIIRTCVRHRPERSPSRVAWVRFFTTSRGEVVAVPTARTATPPDRIDRVDRIDLRDHGFRFPTLDN